MTGYTNPDNLPYPDDYQQPADSPSAFQALAQSVQTALTAAKNYTIGRITQNWGSNTDVAISQAVVSAWKTAIEAREVKAGTGLSGGGTLAATRTLTVDTNTIATRAYADGKVVNASGTSTTVAPSQAAVNSGLSGKADSGHSHAFPFKYGRPNTAFPIGANQSTGNITIAHGLGRAPNGVLVSADDDGGDCSVFASVESWDATNIYAQMRNIGDAEQHVYINWLAW